MTTAPAAAATADFSETLAPGRRLDHLVEEIAHEYAGRPFTPNPSVDDVAAQLEHPHLVAWVAVESNKIALSPVSKPYAYRTVLNDIVDALSEEEAFGVLNGLLAGNDAPIKLLRSGLRDCVANAVQDRIADRIFALEEEQSTDRKPVSYSAIVDDPVRADLIALARGAR